jgi:DNA polymerase III epsilon subunit-like protein
MPDLTPVAFDIETSGLEPASVITVAGFTLELGSWLALNTNGRDANKNDLISRLEAESGSNVQLAICDSEEALLNRLVRFVDERLDDNRHYLTAYNGDVWRGGFDLPFVRTACARHEIAWPFPEMAYADTMDMMKRFYTGDTKDLVGVYDALISKDSCDPFVDSGSAVAAFNRGDWLPLLLHNLADIERTQKLALLAGRYIPKSDFQMKSLTPP